MEKLLKKHTPAELADAFVFPVKLTAKQKKQADEQLAAARKKNQAAMSEETQLVSKLLQLKFQLEDYLEGREFDVSFTFSYFLKAYVGILNKKRKEFASEISIDETMLSQLINTHRTPPDYIAIRLEIHSGNIIPADYWYRLVEKQREFQIKTDKSLRKREMKYVHNRVGAGA